MDITMDITMDTTITAYAAFPSVLASACRGMAGNGPVARRPLGRSGAPPR